MNDFRLMEITRVGLRALDLPMVISSISASNLIEQVLEVVFRPTQKTAASSVQSSKKVFCVSILSISVALLQRNLSEQDSISAIHGCVM